MYLKDYFSLIIKLLKSTQLWFPDKPKSKLDKVLLAIGVVRLIHFIYYVMNLVKIFYLTEDKKTDFEGFIEVFLNGLTLYRIFVFCKNRNNFIEIVKQIKEKDFFKYEAVDGVFEPNLINEKSKNRNNLLIRFYLYLCSMILVISYCPELFRMYFYQKSSSETTAHNIYCKKLIFATVLPFDYSTKYKCTLFLIYQCLLISNCCLFYITMNMTTISIINFLTTQVFILRDAFKTIIIRSKLRVRNGDNIELDKKLYENFKDIVVRMEVVFR